MGGEQSQLIYSVPVGHKDQYILSENDITANKRETKPRRSPQYANKDLESSVTNQMGQKIETLQDMILASEQLFANEMFLYQRDQNGVYQGKTYRECIFYSRQLGSGIINMNLAPEINEYQNIKMQMVGVFMKNRQEWALLDFASYLYGLTMVPLYDTLGPDSISHCLINSGVYNMFASEKSLGNLKTIIAVDEITDNQAQKAQQLGLKLITIEEVVKTGQNQVPLPKYSSDRCFTFSYTSGTTGVPKGALISHRGFASMISVFVSAKDDVPMDKNDCHISYLPLPHLFERMFLIVLTYHGSKIYFYSGDVLKLKNDIADVRPTIFPSVPRLYTKFYDAIKNGLESKEGVSKWLIDQGVTAKLDNLTKNSQYTHAVWDNLVFGKTKQAFGGRVKWMATGSAPISVQTLNFLKVVACCPILEGYGQTESMGASFLTKQNDITYGHVGGPTCNVEFKLVNVDELDYRVTDKDQQGNLTPRGEVCMRGPCVFMGYYKDEEKTYEAIDKDGWLHTGDVGMILPNGALKIIDRKKNIFKLSQGEYVAPEKIENVYKQSKGVAEIFVYGNSLQSSLVALIVPDAVFAKDFAQQRNLGDATLAQLCENGDFKKLILENMAAQEKLFGFEQVREISLEPVSMMEHGCLTNTFKLQRNQATKLFKERLEKLYV